MWYFKSLIRVSENNYVGDGGFGGGLGLGGGRGLFGLGLLHSARCKKEYLPMLTIIDRW